MNTVSTNYITGLVVAVIVAIAALLIWLQHSFGKEIALYAFVAIAAVALFQLGFLNSHLSQRLTLDGHVRIRAQETVIEREQKKTERIQAVAENRLEAKALKIGELMFRYYKATDQAQQAAQQAAQPPAQADFWSMPAEVEDSYDDLQGLF